MRQSVWAGWGVLLLLVMSLGISGCGSGTKRTATDSVGVEIPFRHAGLIRMHDCGAYEKVVVSDPWDSTRLLHTYLLVPRADSLPEGLPSGTVLRVPLRQVVTLSSVHAGLMKRLGVLSCLSGICDTDYVVDSVVRNSIEQGEVVDMGSSMSPNVELLLRFRPEAIWVSPFENSGGYGQLDRIGLPLVECADYMERSALGRAEWMRFYGRLLGCGERADSLFAAIEQRYRNLCRLAEGATERPLLMADRRDGAAWYVPGGQSTLGRLYADAGARYAFSDYAQSGSVSLSFETVYRIARDADVWIIKYGQREPLTYKQLKADYAPYAGFKPWREQKIYGCNTMCVPFYEEEPFSPDLLLSDLVAILHPTVLPDAALRYFTPLEP